MMATERTVTSARFQVYVSIVNFGARMATKPFLVHSKIETRRFPKPIEVLSAVRLSARYRRALASLALPRGAAGQ